LYLLKDGPNIIIEALAKQPFSKGTGGLLGLSPQIPEILYCRLGLAVFNQQTDL
jgi:hypothetical protein